MLPRCSFLSPLGFLLLLLAAGVSQAEDFQGSTHPLPYDEEYIRYSESKPADPVAELQRKIEAGEIKLRWDDRLGYLPGLLEALSIPAASQMLVFSKTSLQRKEISPSNPRALYFNDDVYIGYIPGSQILEISSVDPTLGGVFYTLEQEKVRKPKFHRDQDCLRCHGGSRSLGVPGHILRSIATDETGELEATREFSPINHCTPYTERWAGWYVSGSHAGVPHLGNLIGVAAFERRAKEPDFAGIDDLAKQLDATKYPRPSSDIVAMSVLAHQAHMHNYITRLNFETRIMTGMYGHVRYLKNQVNAFLRYLLFTEEAPLTAPLIGDPTFAKEFQAAGPRDSRGRSLRDLDLQTQLFKYPCSFLIYTPAFDAMPDVIREVLLQRLYAILTGADQDPQFARLKAEDRQAILEILRETKPNLPAYWREAKVAAAATVQPGR